MRGHCFAAAMDEVARNPIVPVKEHEQSAPRRANHLLDQPLLAAAVIIGGGGWLWRPVGTGEPEAGIVRHPPPRRGHVVRREDNTEVGFRLRTHRTQGEAEEVLDELPIASNGTREQRNSDENGLTPQHPQRKY